MQIISDNTQPTSEVEYKAMEAKVHEGMNELLHTMVEGANSINPVTPIAIPGLTSLSVVVIVSGHTAAGLATVSGTTMMHRKPPEMPVEPAPAAEAPSEAAAAPEVALVEPSAEVSP